MSLPSITWPLLGRRWVQTVEGHILCDRCGKPSETGTFRTIHVEEMGVSTTIRQSGPLCPTCDAEEAQR